MFRPRPLQLVPQSLRNEGEEFPNQTLMVVVTRSMSGVCVRQEPPRLVIQEPDIVVRELGLKDGHVDVVEELGFYIQRLAASRVTPT